MDALRKSENWLRKLSAEDIEQNPKFQDFLQTIRSHDESVRARKWLSAHDEIESAFAQFVDITNQIMVKAKKDLDQRDSKERPVYEMLEEYRSSLKQISRAAQTIADSADGLLGNLERSPKR